MDKENLDKKGKLNAKEKDKIENKKIVPVKKDIKIEVIASSDEGDDSMLEFLDEGSLENFHFRGTPFSDVSLNRRIFFEDSLEEKLIDAPRIESNSDNQDVDYLKKPEENGISYTKVDAFKTEDESLTLEQRQIEDQRRIYSSVEGVSDRMKSLHESEQKREYFTAEDIKKKKSFFGMR